ncbi:MAG: guanylate kinase [Acidobacteria bacterium RIFCSPLOWO2_02_FULL_60_20]|nr:MAG: guanylate kinase [Acidobacteria bacterium RIFCSPLOWO2_02_FULL_60_20]OFW17181.1 MAG: guanylate kinase [Acidobacteria bacterium RIFCSPLOWO2_12_FULL_66_10]
MTTGVYIVSAPSGSGKTTLVERLLREVPRLRFSISYTTRKPRRSEQDGRDYFFVTRDEFQQMIARQELLEWAEVFGNYYGTSRRFLEEARAANTDLLLDIDIQGARQVKEKLPEAVSIFILPPSRQVLEHRLRSRSQDSEEVIAKRLEDARREIHGYIRYDYVLINEELDRSAKCLRDIVLAERWRRKGRLAGEAPAESLETIREIAESCRTARVQDQVQPILQSFGG